MSPPPWLTVSWAVDIFSCWKLFRKKTTPSNCQTYCFSKEVTFQVTKVKEYQQQCIPSIDCYLWNPCPVVRRGKKIHMGSFTPKWSKVILLLISIQKPFDIFTSNNSYYNKKLLYNNLFSLKTTFLTLSLIRQFCSRRLWTYFVKI